MHDTLQTWLAELQVDLSVTHLPDLHAEAMGNIVIFGVSAQSLASWGQDDIAEFLQGCRRVYEDHNDGAPMVFYAWYDQQAGQLRMSAVSQSHGRLPFRCALNVVELEVLVAALLREDSGLYSRGALDLWKCSI